MASSSTAQVPGDEPPPYSKSDPTPHKTRNGIPPDHRRSMEDASREVPQGWIRQYDPQSSHQFYVDTHTERAIWHHPYDDDEYMASLSPEQRARIKGLSRVPTDADIIAESSDDENHDPRGPPQRQDSNPSGMKKFGRKIKDKVTSSTHQEREAQRKKRAEEEQKAYQRHLALRQAMQKAVQTGQPQLIGKDREGRDCYLTPPQGVQGQQYNQNNTRMINPFGPPMGGGMMGGGMMGGGGMYGGPMGGYGMYGRPAYGYSRPYGYGYGGGLGLPIMGGLAGGALLGGLLF
ncbi:hypothetical protein D6C98_07809 [Aureobasidium pullulans]|nr:hypothetical protein D6C98_07809 [Aureobasidium pullulans]